jgi:tetratricopeptide (TPR) repeat protein
MPRWLTLLIAAGLAACASKPPPADDAPTLKSLASRAPALPKLTPLASNETQALQAWRALLADAPTAQQRARGMRRLGDLEMDHTDAQLAQGEGNTAAGSPDYRQAISQYHAYLKAYPNDPANDQVLYQLARAHEQGGDLETALKVIAQLVRQYPETRHLDEAQFRRGELLFTARQYPQAEAAYAAVLASPRDTPYRERALYMQGWSQFKQARLEPALESFLGVLDLKLAGRDDTQPLEELPGLSRADRELVDDSFRVVSLALENLQGAQTIPAFTQSPARQSYELRLYQQLAALYLKQDRPKDAADTYGAFVSRHPLHAQAPVLQTEVIAVHEKAGFAALALQAKKEFVERYGANSPFRQSNRSGWERAQPLVKTHLAELARHYHALSQQSQAPAEVRQEAVRAAVQWYQALLKGFPTDAEAAPNSFLLAELLYEDKRYADAAAQYTLTAYQYPAHARSADAGYAALLALAQQTQGAAPEQQARLRRDGVASGLRFAKAFANDPRATAVLVNAADTLYQLGDAQAAAEVARQALAAQAPATPATAEQRRVAWTVLALTSFEAGQFADAEKNIAEVLTLTPANTPEGAKKRNDWVERQAAAIYKQGEQARNAGQARQAAALFARVGEAAPQSAVRVAAQFDAATQWLALKDWPAAIRVLEDFRQRFPRDPLQAQVPAKLALAYSEQGLWTQAAGEFERVAQAATEPEMARAALWQTATLFDKAYFDQASAQSGTPAAQATATKAWERYLRSHPAPLAPALEARAHLATLAKTGPNAALRAKAELAWQREIFQAEQAGGNDRTPRTRTLGAQAALALAEPEFEAYRKIALVEPLQKTLKLKKAKLEDVLKAYAQAADYGVAEVVTAATFHTAAIYQDFGKSLLESQRPKKLSKLEREQYDVLLEEQAFPFEEKAIELHELNARRASEGIYDSWVQQSFAALAKLRPVRYGKAERADAGATSEAAKANQQAVALRLKGEFGPAREAYEKALALDPAYAPAALNLGVLHDLYLGHPADALGLYERYMALTPAGDAQVGKWIADLKNRKPAPVAASGATTPPTTASPPPPAKEKP